MLEALVKTVEPQLHSLRLWLGQVDDEPRFRYGAPELDMGRAAEDRVDVGGQRNGSVP
jgi:hypothetical protein